MIWKGDPARESYERLRHFEFGRRGEESLSEPPPLPELHFKGTLLPLVFRQFVRCHL